MDYDLAVRLNLENILQKQYGKLMRARSTVEEACKLINIGYEYMKEMDGIKIFSKRK